MERRGGQPGFNQRGQIGVGAADEDADTLVLFRPIGAAGDGGEGGRSAGLGDDRHVGPETALGVGDRRMSPTRTTLLTNRLAILKLSSPTRFAPSELAAIDLTETSTGAFASSAA